jgi:hypothetical protein
VSAQGRSAAFLDELKADLSQCHREGDRARFGPWLDHLAHELWRLEQRRWKQADIDYWKTHDQEVRERQRRCKATLKDLEDQLKEPGSDEERERLRAAITALKAVRFDLPWGELFGPRKAFGPATLTARIIGGLTLTCLREADEAAGRKPRDRLDAAAIAFVVARLDRCLEGDQLPDHKEIAKALRELRES